MTALIALDEDPVRAHRVATSSTPTPRRSRADDAGRRRLPAAVVPDRARPLGRRPDVPTRRDADDRIDDAARRRPDARDRRRVLRQAPHRSRRRRRVRRTRSTIRCSSYLRTSQRHATDPAPWLRGADIVLVGEPGTSRRPASRSSRFRSRRSATAVPTTASTCPRRCCRRAAAASSDHGHADRPPLTVGGDLGEYVTGAFAALGAATAWWRASRTGVAELVDVSMLEAMQMTFVTVPTLMARFPGRPARDVDAG